MTAAGYGTGDYGEGLYGSGGVVVVVPPPTVAPEPLYSDAFEMMWSRIPAIYRTLDAANSYQLKRWFAGIGDQYGGVVAYAERFLYVSPDRRDLRHLPPQTSGAMYYNEGVGTDTVLSGSADWSSYQGYGADPMGSIDNLTSYYVLENFTDGAYVQWTPYLPSGTYQVQYEYINKATNGVATLSVDDVDVRTLQQNTGTWTDGSTITSSDVSLTPPYKFTVERGYLDLRVRFDTDQQTDNTKRITVGRMFITNLTVGYQYDTSDLVNPYSADPSWLPWLAILFGVQLDLNEPVANQRARIVNATNGFLSGTKEALIEATKPYLNRTRTVRVFDHSLLDSINGGGQWDVLVVTRTSETPSGIDIPTLLTNAGVKPAGVVLHHQMYEASWSVIETDRPTWQGSGTNSWEPNTWTIIEETGLL